MQDIKSLFPAKVEITQDIIDKSDISNIFNCIGAKALGTVVGDKLEFKKKTGIYPTFHWGNYHGVIELSEEEVIWITTEEDVPMMNITEPTTVTLVVES